MKIEPLAQGFGAEVIGFDVRHGRAPADVSALRSAYEQWNLLIFRGCGLLAPERQVEITGWFGPIGANRDEQGRPWTVLHNDNATGSAELPFHCDISFLPHPLEGISLHPQALPDVETSTTFIRRCARLAASCDWRARIQGTIGTVTSVPGRHKRVVMTAAASETTLSWRALRPFGVEMQHNLSAPLSREQEQQFVALLWQHNLILARNQTLSMERQRELCGLAHVA